MALVQRGIFRVKAIFARCNTRAYSSPVGGKAIKKSVFISESKDIYTNLALEDWLYRNFDFRHHHVLMLWQNNPCVSIGRHQNPWLEANIADLELITENGVKLARRNSGGGTVFHDQGSLNMTFFTSRNSHNTRYNLEIVSRALFRKYNLKTDISSTEDLTLLNQKQVSGTAAKLGKTNSYHHCSLLVSANKINLSQALHKDDVTIETNATKSVKSKITNLCEENPKVDVKTLYNAIGWEYLRTSALAVKDGGMELASKQNGFHLINPTEQWFPGIEEIRNRFESWQWRFGKTPKFTISRSFAVPETFAHPEIPEDLKVTMVVEDGKINDVNLYVPPGLISRAISGNVNVITTLIGHKFSEDILESLDWPVSSLISEKDGRQVMQSNN